MKTKTVLFFTFLLSTTFTVTSQPALNWHANFNGGSNATDKVVSIAVDNNCNTIVTGQSDSIGQGIDIVTIKYDLNGNIVWQQRFDGADHLDDIPTDLKVDPNGNVYVCGRTQGTSTGFDFVTLKYTASGTLASGNWPAYYNNARWNGVNGFDGAESMAISPLNGNIYVAGESNNHLWTNSWLDLFMLRYDTLGNVVDSGVSGNGSLRDDYVKQVSFDNAGNVDLLMYDGIGFNSIYHYTPTLFNLSSSTFWNGLAVPPTNVSVDIASNKYYCFNTSTGFSEVKVSNTNSIFWNNAFRRTLSSVDDVKSIAVDNAGNSFVVASSTMSGASDIWLLKLTSNGDTVWTRTWGTGNGANDIPVKILQTSSPTRIVIVGNSTIGGVSTIVTLKYDTSGVLQSSYPLLYNSSTDIATAMTKDAFGNIFIGGYEGSAGSEDFISLKYRMNAYTVLVNSVNGDSLYVSPAATGYQWYKDGIALIGDTLRGIHINSIGLGNGMYSCLVEQYCTSYWSDTLNATTVGTNQLDPHENLFSVIASSKSTVSILFHKNLSSATLQVFNVNGQVVYTKTMANVLMGVGESIDVDLKTGNYIFSVTSGSNVQVLSMVFME